MPQLRANRRAGTGPLTTSVLYRIYKQWCTDNNNGYAKTARHFRDGLAALHGTSHSAFTTHTKYGTTYLGLGLNTQTREDYGHYTLKGEFL